METKQIRKTFGEMVQSEPLVLVDFHAEWCGPCKMMKPILEELKSAVGDKVKILKVDVDKNVQTASHYQITGVPTLMLFKKGTPVWRQSGVVTTNALKSLIGANEK